MRASIIYEGKYCHELIGYPLGPYFWEAGHLFAIEGQGVVAYDPDNNRWVDSFTFDFKDDFLLDGVRTGLTTALGTTLIFSPNVSPKHLIFDWKAKKWDMPKARAHGMVLRKPQGKDWTEPVTIVDGYCAAFQSAIQLPSGRIIAATQKYVPKMSGGLGSNERTSVDHGPGGHTSVLAVYSDDDGKSWRTSAAISPYFAHPRPSFHPKGNHGGFLEPSIVQVGEDKVLMLIRTNWGEFWSAVSTDGAENWASLKPSGIPASAAPCALAATDNGVLIVWNRSYSTAPKRERKVVMVGGGKGTNPTFSEVPVSFHGGELTAAVVDPENLETWRETVATIAWVENMNQGALKYPKIFLRDPDTAWVTTSPAGNPEGGDHPLNSASARMSLSISSLIR